MRYITDLHAHSTASDGQYAPAQLVRRAKDRGVEVLALTDHDTVDGIAEAASAGQELGIKVLPGVELSAREHSNFHILGYCYDPEHPALRQLCEEQRANRVKREKMILDFLCTERVKLSMDDVELCAGGKVIGRPHFAQAMVQRGYVKTRQEAFELYLDTPKFWEKVPRLEADAKSCVEAIKVSGGKVSLVHPYQMKLSDQELEELVRKLTDWGLDAIECYYPKYTPKQQALYLKMAEKFGLHITGGSDFHGEKVKPDVQLAALDLNVDWLMELI